MVSSVLSGVGGVSFGDAITKITDFKASGCLAVVMMW